MDYPLRNLIYEKLRSGPYMDNELLNELVKNGYEINMKKLNKVLLQLEILGLVSVRWVGKDKRRIELVEIKEQ
jgi:hypothetical protein